MLMALKKLRSKNKRFTQYVVYSMVYTNIPKEGNKLNELMTIQNVRGYIKNGTAYLSLEDVARGLGFTEVAGSGNTVVKWSRVRGYLTDLNFIDTSGDGSQEVGKELFIPENIFYRLAMKAKNETAEKFQAKVADEILPSIRKHGMYVVDDLINDPDLAIKAFMALKEEREQKKLLEAKIEQDKPKVEFFDQVANSKDAIEIGQAAKVLNVGIGRNRLFEILRDKGILMANNIPYQKYIDAGYFRTIEQKFVKPDGITCINIKTLVYQKGLAYIRKLVTA